MRRRAAAAFWWVLQGSNLRPTACKAVALPTELNTPCQTRWRILTGGLPESIGNAPLADSGIHRTADPAGSDEAQSLWNPGSVVNAPLQSHFRREQAWARDRKRGKPNQMQKIHVPCFPLSFNI